VSRGILARPSRQSSRNVSHGGAFYNLVWVTIGHIVGGAGFVALDNFAVSLRVRAKALAPAAAE